MTEQDKQLLLVDLCGRLPYGVFVNIEGFDYDFNGKLVQVYFGNINRCSIQVGSNISYSLEETKPWLRPMSSMTLKEAKELSILYGLKDILSIKITDEYIDVVVDDGVCSTETRTIWYDEIISSIEIFDWLNAHHFDFRGLIEKGLALEAPKGMYKMEEEQKNDNI